MINKIVTTAMRILVICLAAEAVRQVWNEPNKEEGKKENK